MHSRHQPHDLVLPLAGRNVNELLADIVERTPLRHGKGEANSGATLERVRLSDGTRLVLKHISSATDLLMRLTHDQGRAALLWTTGVFNRFPPGIDHTTIAAAPENDGWVIVMPDVGPAIRGWEHVLTHTERRRLFAAAAALHATFQGQQIYGLCTLSDWLTFVSPAVMTSVRGGPEELPEWVLPGWEVFFEVVPHDLSAAVTAIHAQPAAIVREIESAPSTFLHGDLSPGNIGFTSDRVLLLDWGLATWAPAVLDYTLFMANLRWRAGATPEQIIDEIRALFGEQHDERLLRIALLATMAIYGWLLADRAMLNPNAAERPRETIWLDWWVDLARNVLDTTWSPN